MSKENNQKIKCDVHSCKHNNQDDNLCDLEEIKVSCTCDNDDCDCSNDTVCYSFEENDEKTDVCVEKNDNEDDDIEDDDMDDEEMEEE